MKIASFIVESTPTYGIVMDDGSVREAPPNLKAACPDLRSVLEHGRLDELRQASGPAIPAASVTWLPPIPKPDKIFCIGLNYATHIAETGRKPSEYPAVFTRVANAQVGHLQDMILPRASEQFDYEGELAFVIGKPCRHVKKADALSVIAGYTCFNDGSIRDWQRHTSQFIPGKNFKDSGSFGPWIVTTDEIPDPSKLRLTTRLNGEVMQDTGTDDLVFDIPYLVEYLSTVTELVPGDVVATGTTGGVGAFRTPPVWMKDGDTVEIDISSIGILRNPIVREGA